MIHNKVIRNSLILFAALILMAARISVAQAHSGHKHDDSEPQTSLPDVVAKVNGVDIKKDDIWADFKAAVETYSIRGTPLSPEQEKTTAKKLIDKEIKKRLVLLRARELNIQVSPESVDKKLQAIKSKFESDTAFEKKLSQKSMTVEQYKEEIKWGLTLEQVIQKEMPSLIEVSPQEIKEYYDKNPEKFSTEEKVRASVILIKVKPNAGEADEKQARDKIEMIANQLKEGSEFAELAKKHSQDSMGPRGGDLGLFHRKQVLPAFSDRAFGMKVGEVSEIFKTSHGYHILKVTEKSPATHSSLEEATSGIVEILRGEKLAKQSEGYNESLRKKADIKFYF